MKQNTTELIASEYQEESVKPAIAAMLVVVIAVSLPLGWMIYKIGDEGFRAADISKYTSLAALVKKNTGTIRKILENDMIDNTAFAGAEAAPVVTLITPDISPTNFDEAAENSSNKLNVRLKAIYWSPHEPLVTIGDENYGVGDKVQGFTIVEIRKTEVVFKSPLGEKVIKYFYEYLEDLPKKR